MDLFLDRRPRGSSGSRTLVCYFWPKGLVPISHEWTWLRGVAAVPTTCGSPVSSSAHWTSLSPI